MRPSFFWALLAILGSTLGFVLGQTPVAPGQLPAKLPKVDRKTHETYVEKLTDDVSFTMIAIPGGSFLMGSPKEEAKRGSDEGPQHPVGIPPFWMGKCEVTWDEYDWYWWKRFPDGQPPPRPDLSRKPDKLSDAVTSPTPPYSDESFGHGRQKNPVVGITQHAAMEYCRWLSQKTGKKYRLPTEAEWEWACRAGTTTAYSFGDDPQSLGEYAWIAKTADEHPHPVGKKKANPWGLHDMYGNAAEWCIDRYGADFYGTLSLDKLSLNPFNPPTENRFPYVARGGSWVAAPENCRSAARDHSDKKWMRRDPQRPQSIWWMTDADHVGFRVVRSLTEDERLTNIRSLVTWWSPD